MFCNSPLCFYPLGIFLLHIESGIAAVTEQLQFAILVATLVGLEPLGGNDTLAKIVFDNGPACATAADDDAQLVPVI